MPSKNGMKKTAGTSDAAVKKATGKSWAEWCRLLDKAGARKMNHAEIVAVVSKRFGVGPWWQQMVTVGYEQARGLRKKHEKPDGYSVSASKTIAAPPSAVFRAWKDPSARKRWLAHPEFTIRTATASKSMRITWVDGRTSVEVMFYPKGPGKSQVTTQHNKPPDARAAEKMKAYWKTQLGKLQAALTGRA